MPRGYLKHSDQVNRKSARGGGSHRSRRGDRSKDAWGGKCGQKQYMTEIAGIDEAEAEFFDGYYAEDQVETAPEELKQETEQVPLKKKRNGSRKKRQSTMCDCPICFESRPVVHLNKVCHWHDAACIECMRSVYVTQAQKSSRNYPTRCFHPLCRKPIRETQLLKHGMIHTEKELKEHYRLTELGKGQQAGWCAVLCPHCDYPKAYKHKENGKNRIFTCVECKKNYMVSPFAEIIRAMENYGEISESSDWAQCPECKMLITKEYGEDDTVCVCGAHFSWTHAQRLSGFHYPFGRPANHGVSDFLYLYW